MSDEKDQLVEALRQRDEARAEVERSLVALGSIGEILFETIVYEHHVEHIVRDHGPVDVELSYRHLAGQVRRIDAICGMFYAPIVEAMERASDLSEPR